MRLLRTQRSPPGDEFWPEWNCRNAEDSLCAVMCEVSPMNSVICLATWSRIASQEASMLGDETLFRQDSSIPMGKYT
jgi:hypothetical protein